MVKFSSFTFNLIFTNTVVQCENAFGMIGYIYAFIMVLILVWYEPECQSLLICIISSKNMGCLFK